MGKELREVGGEAKIMGFFWICPCGHENFYSGSKTTNVVVTCKGCKAKVKASSHKKPSAKKEKNYQTQPKTTTKLPTIEDVLLGSDLNRSVLIEGLNDTIRIYRNSILDREGKRLAKGKAREGKRVLEWVERYENQLGVPLLVVHHPYFRKVLNAYQELEKLRV